MADAAKIVVIDGVRYREEDAPKAPAKDAEHKMRKPADKARTASK